MVKPPVGLSFLIVDDEGLVRLGLSRHFAKHGHVAVAASVVEARSVLERVRVDALIADVELSDGSGFDVVEHAREHSPDVLAVILSVTVDAPRLAQAFSMDVAFLLKPASPADLSRFAERARLRWLKRNARWYESVLGAWVTRYELTPAEGQVLALALNGLSRMEIAKRRDVTTSTLKKQVQSLLAKTGDTSLEGAANRALRSALERP